MLALAVAWMGGGGDDASAPQELHLDEASFSASGQDCDTRIPVEVHVVNGHTEPMHDVVVEFDAYDSDGFAADETFFEYVGTLSAGERRVVAGQIDFTPERCGTADTVNVEAVAGVCLDASCSTYEVLDDITQQITM